MARIVRRRFRPGLRRLCSISAPMAPTSSSTTSAAGAGWAAPARRQRPAPHIIRRRGPGGVSEAGGGASPEPSTSAIVRVTMRLAPTSEVKMRGSFISKFRKGRDAGGRDFSDAATARGRPWRPVRASRRRLHPPPPSRRRGRCWTVPARTGTRARSGLSRRTGGCGLRRRPG